MSDHLIKLLQANLKLTNEIKKTSDMTPLDLLNSIKDIHILTDINKALVELNKIIVNNMNTLKLNLCDTLNQINALNIDGDPLSLPKMKCESVEIKHPVESENKTIEIEVTPGLKVKYPVISNLKNIPNCIYYYLDSNNKHTGYYLNLNGVIVQIPLIKQTKIDNDDYNNYKTVKCTRIGCTNIKCRFVHKYEKYNRVNVPARCPNCPGFGDINTIKSDITKIQKSDLLLLMMYSLSDLHGSMIYLQKQNINDRVLHNIDVCE